MKMLNFVMTALVAGSLVACGGSGGGTTTGSTNSGSASTTTASISSYSGSKTEARLSASNSKAFIRNVFEGEAASSIARRAESGDSQPQVSIGNTRLDRAVDQAITQGITGNSRYQERAVNNVGSCAYGGTVTVTGNLDDSTLSGNLSMSFNQCQTEPGVSVSGSTDVYIRKYDLSINDVVSGTYYFNAMTVRAGNYSYLLSGKIEREVKLDTATIYLLDNYYVREASSGAEALREDYLSGYRLFSATDYAAVFDGKLYDSNYGFIKVATPQVLSFSGSSHPYRGEMVLTGYQKSAIQLQFIATDRFVANIDANGDGAYESSQTLYWSSL